MLYIDLKNLYMTILYTNWGRVWTAEQKGWSNLNVSEGGAWDLGKDKTVSEKGSCFQCTLWGWAINPLVPGK